MLLSLWQFWTLQPKKITQITNSIKLPLNLAPKVHQLQVTFFIIKPTRCTNFPNLFWYETLHVSGSSSLHHQEFIHCTLGTGVRHTGLKAAFEQDQDGPVRKLSCRVSCKNKFGKLVHLVGFIIKKFLTKHGHMNVKKYKVTCWESCWK